MLRDISTLADAQQDMRHGYFSGAPGMFASALVWLAAGVTAARSTPERAIAVLFFGGMAIHPIGVVLAKVLGRPGAHTRGNPLGALALEATGLLLLGFPLAYAASKAQVHWFFPAMLLVIGGRYLTFATLYGRRVYWACGGTLAIAAFLLVQSSAPMAWGGFAGAAVEGIFALALFLQERTTGQSRAER